MNSGPPIDRCRLGPFELRTLFLGSGALLVAVLALIALPSAARAADPVAGATDAVTSVADGAGVTESVQPVQESTEPTVEATQPVVEATQPVVGAAQPVTGPVVEGTQHVIEAAQPVTETVAETAGAIVAPVTETAAPIVETMTEAVVEPVTSTVVEPVTATVPAPLTESTVEHVAHAVELAVQPVAETALVLDTAVDSTQLISEPSQEPTDEPVTAAIARRSAVQGSAIALIDAQDAAPATTLPTPDPSTAMPADRTVAGPELASIQQEILRAAKPGVAAQLQRAIGQLISDRALMTSTGTALAGLAALIGLALAHPALGGGRLLPASANWRPTRAIRPSAPYG